MADKPWINNYGQQQNSNSPAVDDLYKSPNVFINGIPVVLYAPPQANSAPVSTTTTSSGDITALGLG